MEERTITDRSVWVFDLTTRKWVRWKFANLKSGDIFKITDGDERYTNWETGDSVWIAEGEPYQNEDGVLTIKTLY